MEEDIQRRAVVGGFNGMLCAGRELLRWLDWTGMERKKGMITDSLRSFIRFLSVCQVPDFVHTGC